MKKILILLALSFSLIVDAQIQRSFFDFTFGVTSKSKVYNYFNAKGNRIRIVDNNILAVNNVRFGGFDWGVSYFDFYNDKFYKVTFMSSEHDTTKDNLDVQWELLNSKISSKYFNNFLDGMSSTKEKWFVDSRTTMKLEYSLFQGLWALSIVYFDSKIYNERSEKEDNEL